MPGTTMGRILAALMAGAILAGPAAAQAPGGAPPLSRVPADQVPLPPPRPEESKEPVAKEPASKESAVKDAVPKETDKDTPVPEPTPLPPERPADLPSGPAPTPATLVPDDTACLRRLERLGVKAESVAPLADGLCGAAKPLRVTVLPDGVPLSPAATLTCVAAEALGRWSTEVRVIAERTLSTVPKTVQIGGSYECRGQNHDPSAKLSEHAYANGVDVMGFTFEGRAPVMVGAVREGTPEAAFENAVRARACGFFRTVLGPGSDAAHANHLHLDERERNAGHRLCQ
ncbi:extensin-like domain-containing protein [Methylobacterium sp. SyP6R]|uniref:extensin-like domain-containing protein n=1 Tax=Methylobacterium sp. SyP6R TaxID=2718876 RepID=UPI001F174FB5|nr:extensin family protein [Methylobacterium sp. SyP6R]MCF4125737.1 extensin family protein [Methylobacterium sp. SyP6R]